MLTIQLENQLACYSGHEHLRGCVVYHCPNPIDIQEVRVSFYGRAKAKVQKIKGATATFRSKSILFHEEKTLATPNGGQLARNTYEWPFEFTFPSQVESPSKWPEKAPFRSDEHHPLPPSFAVDVGDSQRKLHCVIEYRIEVQMFKPQKTFLSKKAPLYTEALRVNFLPLAAQWEPTDHADKLSRKHKDEVFTVRSLLLLPENRGRSLKVGEKFQSWLSKKQLPQFDFKASFIYSTRVLQGSPVACLLDVVPCTDGSSMPFPGITLQSVSVAVMSRTSARASQSLRGSITGEVDDRLEILSKTSLGMPVLGPLDLNETFGPLIFRHSDVSFSTFTISRSYRLCASFTFECVGKTFEFNANDLEFFIVSDVVSPTVQMTPMEQGTAITGVFELADTTSRRSSSDEYDDSPPSYSMAAPDSEKPPTKN
ncbi:hypothetical protein BDV32DRAFT_80693 [Aspergillus pseudonomiae]|uniref:Uncharacterized protein n=1 Tax=Aspergillus pseudonomiae TaxID=1506151 RepID=A0A5N6HW18_9EURO|nr:uncharacterized protein BDV37DRAFT_151420 [Aspergillus pseudonomiae]KAB8257600.1 hypothetical protein BDV32DRAFT_80693 [Aspergillus pseudonomiae]KAE8402934.1 hypothetical protein BDV37DRAFT_151420 [Aspergillus pseudonomiae]